MRGVRGRPLSPGPPLCWPFWETESLGGKQVRLARGGSHALLESATQGGQGSPGPEGVGCGEGLPCGLRGLGGRLEAQLRRDAVRAMPAGGPLCGLGTAS